MEIVLNISWIPKIDFSRSCYSIWSEANCCNVNLLGFADVSQICGFSLNNFSDLEAKKKGSKIIYIESCKFQANELMVWVFDLTTTNYQWHLIY